MANKKILVLFSIVIFSIFLISIVSAGGCCKITKNGGTCVYIDNPNDCEKDYYGKACKDTEDCKTGTCIKDGICSVSPKYKCDIANWNPSTINNIDQCKFGCCLKPNGYKEYMIKMKCSSLGGSFTVSDDIKGCHTLTEEMGACVLNDKSCKFVTEKDCVTNLHGESHRGILCSNSELDTICAGIPPKIKTTCYNNKVYFLDSCGNLANVYDKDKISDDNYWNFVQSSDCSVDLSEPDSINTCGNCDGKNSICDPSSQSKCKDLGCIDEEDKDKQIKGNQRWENGESHCIYESAVGDSRDVVGSAHWIRYCDRGEIKTHSCDDYRGEICAEKVVGGKTTAQCRANEGYKCIGVEMEEYKYNIYGYEIDSGLTFENNNKTCTDASPDCKVKTIDLYHGHNHNEGMRADDKWFNGFIWDNYDWKPVDEFRFDSCVPKYPVGLQFWNSESDATDVCGIMDSTNCKTYWEFDGVAWWCKGNCECLEPEYSWWGYGAGSLINPQRVTVGGKNSYTNQMNELCRSLGDCGMKANTEGKSIENNNFNSYNIWDNLNSLIWWKSGVGGKSYYYLDFVMGGDGDSGYRKFTTVGKITMDNAIEYKSYADDPNIGKGDPPKFKSLGAKKDMSGSLQGISGDPKPWNWISHGGRDQSTVDVTFECQPWSQPSGGGDCDKCDDDPLRPCTEYKCKSLGANCEILTDVYETDKKICINSEPDDDTPPTIVLDHLEDEDNYNVDRTKEKTENRIEIRTSGGECLQESSLIKFTLKTEEKGKEDYAKCVYSWSGNIEVPGPENNYALKGDGEFKEENSNSLIHTFDGRLPYVLFSKYVSDVSGELGEREGNLNMHVRCIDSAGNPSEDYVVNLCIKEGLDTNAANIIEYSPESGSILKYNKPDQDLEISLDKPAECRFSYDTDKAYDEMENFMTCEGRSIKVSYNCSTTVTGLTNSENKIYIKCKNQPWICTRDPNQDTRCCGKGEMIEEEKKNCCCYEGIGTDADRKINELGFLYTLYPTPSELSISSISPQGTLSIGGEIPETTLSAVTSGGAYNGNADCSYEFITPSDLFAGDYFSETDSTIHRQPGLAFPSGDYDIKIICEDKAGNSVTGNAVFSLLVDEEAPKVVRAYKDAGNLRIITNEKAKCYYSNSNCTFDLEKGILMTTGAFDTKHSTAWKSKITYYIKCKDLFETPNEDCAIKIIPSS